MRGQNQSISPIITGYNQINVQISGLKECCYNRLCTTVMGGHSRSSTPWNSTKFQPNFEHFCWQICGHGRLCAVKTRVYHRLSPVITSYSQMNVQILGLKECCYNRLCTTVMGDHNRSWTPWNSTKFNQISTIFWAFWLRSWTVMRGYAQQLWATITGHPNHEIQPYFEHFGWQICGHGRLYAIKTRAYYRL
jgi:hypothetical protein